MQYTVIKDDGKFWVMEYPGRLPVNNWPGGDKAIFETKLILAMKHAFRHYRQKYKISFDNKLPTLSEHADHWAALEGKVIEESKFEIKNRNTDDIIDFPGTGDMPTYGEENYVVPVNAKQSEDDLWEKALKEAERHTTIMQHWSPRTLKYLDDHFTIKRK